MICRQWSYDNDVVDPGIAVNRRGEIRTSEGLSFFDSGCSRTSSRGKYSFFLNVIDQKVY